MFYNMQILDFHGRECEIRLYERPVEDEKFRCDEYGVILPRPSYCWRDDVYLCAEDMEDSGIFEWFDEDMFMANGGVKIHSLEEIEKRAEESKRSSLSRTRSKVYSLSRGVDWDWFVTFTFDPYLVDRYSWEDCSQKIKNWLSYQRRQHSLMGFDMKYMVVPEMHKDGAWHFHGIFSDFSPEIAGFVRADTVEEIYNLASYKFGFSTATRVNDQLAVSNYILKYITKDMVSVTKGKKRYWASRNLKGPKRIDLSLGASSRSREDVILSCLGDSVKYVNRVDSPAGSIVYLQLAGDFYSHLDKLVAEGELKIEDFRLTDQ